MSVRLGRLPRRADFLRIAAERRKFAAPGLVLQAAPTPAELLQPGSNSMRVGFTATRKIGGAVVRNRVRRRLRAAARDVLPACARPGFDYVLIGREGTALRPYAALKADLELALRRLGAASI